MEKFEMKKLFIDVLNEIKDLKKRWLNRSKRIQVGLLHRME